MTNKREPNYKLGWLIPNQVAALTHFHADVTQEDFMGVVQAGNELLANVQEPFHVIIDNRVIAMPAPATLTQMRDMVPYMSHPQLRWVIVVKPVALDLDTSTLLVESVEATQLKNVSSLSEAIDCLKSVADDIHWEKASTHFFPNYEWPL